MTILTASSTPTMSIQALDAITVIEAATMFGLPVPFAMHFNTRSVDGTLRSYDEIATWAEHLDADVIKRPFDDQAHYTVTGTLAGAKVTVGAIDDARADQ